MSNTSRLFGNLLLPCVSLLLVACDGTRDPVAVGEGSSLEAARAGSAITACGALIDRPGVYHLTLDLLACPENGINILSNHVTLYLDGHTISGSDSAFGINVGRGARDGVSHLRIVGPGTVEHFSIGVLNELVTNSTFTGLICRQNDHGFTLNAAFPSRYQFLSAHDSVLNSQFVDNKYHGVSVNGATTSLFRDNYFAGNGAGQNDGFGLYLYNARAIRVHRNRIVDNLQYGIVAQSGSLDNVIVGNTILRSGRIDFYDHNCSGNTFRENQYGSAFRDCFP